MLENLLREHQTEISALWLDLVLQSYPPETAMFLKENKDEYANPIGAAFRKGVDGITDCFARKAKDREIYPLVDDVMQIGAVQDITPSEFLRFLFYFKEAIRTVLADDAKAGRVAYAELAELEARIDETVLMSFDSYVEHRNKLYEIRVKELRAQTDRILERFNMTEPTVEFELGAGGDDEDEGEGSCCSGSAFDPATCGSCTACGEDEGDDE